MANILQELVGMSNKLGSPESNYAVFGEGCTAARIDGNRLYIKASGVPLSECSCESFVEVSIPDIIGIMDEPEISFDEAIRRLNNAKVYRVAPQPPVETVFLAYLLTLPGVNFAGYTHPAAISVILCSNAARVIVESRVMPFESVMSKARSVFVPYTGSEAGLAKVVCREVSAFIEREGTVPNALLIENCGLVALGEDAREVELITLICTKNARILAGAYILGGIHCLDNCIT